MKHPTVLVTDTHPLVWFACGQREKLSRRVRNAFEAAIKGAVAIWVPAVVLWEWSLLIKIGRIRELETLEALVRQGFHAKAMPVLDLTPEDVVLSHGLKFSDDIFDTMIVAMARRLDCPLITRDAILLRAMPCEVYWD